MQKKYHNFKHLTARPPVKNRLFHSQSVEGAIEIISSIKTLKMTHAKTYFMHESVHVDDPEKYTRPWFSWANSLFGELILEVAEKNPQVLEKTF